MKSLTRTGLELYYFATIAFAPFYFGGERLLSWGISGVLQSILYIALLAISPESRSRPRREAQLYQLGFFCISVSGLWALIQLIPISDNPLAHFVWDLSSDVLKTERTAPIAISPDEGFLTFIKMSIVVITVLNGKRLYSFGLNPTRLIAAIGIIGTVYAMIGLIWLQYYPGTHFWLANSPYSGTLVSTYINRNSFAEYMGLCLICVVALALREWRHAKSGRRLFAAIRTILLIATGQFVLYVILASVLLIALMLTASRAGIALSLCALVIPVVSAAMTKEKNWVYPAFGVLPALFLIYVIYGEYGAAVDNRSASLDADFFSRALLYREIVETISERPFIGFGLGAFEAAFRYHKSINFDPSGIWLRAHNVYLELILALGLPGALLCLFGSVTPLLIQIRRLLKSEATTISFVVIAAYVLILFHSLFDFGIQAGGTAVSFAALVGASLSPSQKRAKSV